jgi:hypothetical protein
MKTLPLFQTATRSLASVGTSATEVNGTVTTGTARRATVERQLDAFDPPCPRAGASRRQPVIALQPLTLRSRSSEPTVTAIQGESARGSFVGGEVPTLKLKPNRLAVCTFDGDHAPVSSHELVSRPVTRGNG